MFISKRRNLFIAFSFSVLVLICAPGISKERYIQVFFPNGHVVTAELAKSAEHRSRGLMYRKRLYEDQGMLFVFEEEGRHSFWMKNMEFSIDILWLDRQKRIVHIERRVPPCQDDPCPSYQPDYPSLYVLELKAGAADNLNLQIFDRIEFVLNSLRLWQPKLHTLLSRESTPVLLLH